MSLVAADAELHPELLASFDELLRRQDARRSEGGRSDACVRAVLLALFSAPHTVTVHVESLPADGVVVERRVTREGPPAVFRETLAHAMYGAVAPWLAPKTHTNAGEIAPAPALALAPALAPAPGLAPELAPASALRPRAITARVGAGFGGVWWSGAAPDLRFLGAVSAVLPGDHAPRIGFRAGVSVPRHDDSHGLPARRWSSFGRLTAGARLYAWGRYELAALGLVGLDLLSVTPYRLPQTYALQRAGVQALPSVGALASLHVAMSARAELALEAGVDIALRRLRYVARADTDIAFFVSPRALPYAQLVISFAGMRMTRGAR